MLRLKHTLTLFAAQHSLLPSIETDFFVVVAARFFHLSFLGSRLTISCLFYFRKSAQSIAIYLTRRGLDISRNSKNIDLRILELSSRLIAIANQRMTSVFTSDSLNFRNCGSRTLANDTNHSRLS